MIWRLIDHGFYLFSGWIPILRNLNNQRPDIVNLKDYWWVDWRKKKQTMIFTKIITYFQLLHLKLFLILGLLWTMESVHFIIHTYGELCDTFVGLDIFFRVIDCFNILRGFFFLIIFVCNKITLVKISQFWYVRYNPESDKERSVDTIF